jgi:predicted metalloprotease with PDZ domain
MSDDWYVRKDQKALGPFTEAQLRKGLATGRITGKTAVRKGLDGPWTPAARVFDKRDREESPAPAKRKPIPLMAIAVVVGLAVVLGGLRAVFETRNEQAPSVAVNKAQHFDAPTQAAVLPKPPAVVDSPQPSIRKAIIQDAPAPEIEPIRYTVRFAMPSKHIAEVEGSYPTEGRATLELMMPIWTPGYYHVLNHAGQVQGFSARASDGRILVVAHPKSNRWTIHTLGAKNVIASYKIKCESSSVIENCVNDDMAVLNGAATFVTLMETANRPHEIQLELAPSWKQSISGLNVAPDRRANHYRAADFDTLVDSPIVAGNLDIHEFEVDGSKHVVANAGDCKSWDGKRAAADLEKLVREERRMWGFLPFKQYVFLCVFRQGGGGLEHRNSTLLNSSKAAMRTPASYVMWLTFVSHEYFHAFNVKRLRPVELGPFDYENVPRTSGLWVAEGITSYYDGLVATRTGLAAPKDFLARLSKTIERVQKSPGRLHQTLEQSSLDVWTSSFSGYGGDTNKTVSYYDKGCVVAFLLDAKVRRETHGNKTLDDVMKLAYSRYSAENGFTAEQFRKTAEEVAGADLQAWFKKAVASAEELDYAEALEWFGLQFAPDAGKAKTWRLETRPDATAAQRGHLKAWLEPAAASTAGSDKERKRAFADGKARLAVTRSQRRFF